MSDNKLSKLESDQDATVLVIWVMVKSCHNLDFNFKLLSLYLVSTWYQEDTAALFLLRAAGAID